MNLRDVVMVLQTTGENQNNVYCINICPADVAAFKITMDFHESVR